MIFSSIVLGIAILLASYLAFSPTLTKSSRWKATVTPLASIMGSGFLVSAPLLGGSVGNLAVICMGLLLVLAFSVGSAIRFNIRHFEPIENDGHGPAQSIAFLSRIVLAGAYFISVTYYLQLLAAFLTNAIGISNEMLSRTITTVLLCVIGGIGMWQGLGMLERLEKYAVALNLGMIGALLVALACHNTELLLQGAWSLPDVSSEVDLHDFRVLLGLLIVVQGFETSRYLGDTHSAEERISTMRFAQFLSASIYLIFIGLVTVQFQTGMGADVTAIVEMTRPIALVLPMCISMTAIGSQFSASVADNEGAGGLIEELTHHRVPIRYAYLLILVVTLLLTWETNVNEIISYASRAFALYYALQCMVAIFVAWEDREIENRTRNLTSFVILTAICFLVFGFGLPAE